MSDRPRPHRIEGYAIVSDDGMIADASGVMPEALKIEADKHFFERGLDRVDVVVHGRHSNEQQPHSNLRRRLVLTRRIAALAPDRWNEKAWLWNPAGASLEQALAALGAADVAGIGVVGGTEVFGLFLYLYDVFHLSRAAGVRLPGGRPVFPGVPTRTPEEVLASHGLGRGRASELDRAKGLTLCSWRRPRKSRLGSASQACRDGSRQEAP
jgi:dihydrofolate reductase